MEFSVFYRAEMPALVRHLMFHGASLHEAADAAQTAFVAAVQKWETIHHPRAWLRTVAMRAYLRSTVPEVLTGQLPDQAGLVSAGTPVEFDQEEQAVLDALAALPLRQRQVMAWVFDGYSPTEIADALGVDPASVRQNLLKARRNLTKLLGLSREEA